MKTWIVKTVWIAVIMLCSISAGAQRRGRSNATQGSTLSTKNEQHADTIRPGINKVYANMRFEVVPGTGGFARSSGVSQKNDSPFDKPTDGRIVLPYEYTLADDALFVERVWREIDTREKINQVFRYGAENDNGDQRLISILVNMIRDSLAKGKSIAFSADDDRFTTPLDSVAFEKTLTGGNTCDTLPVYRIDPPDMIDHFAVFCNSLGPDDIVRLRIKEDWYFDRESSRMFVRIIGIAPLKTIYGIDKKTERGTTPLFWVYYPEIRGMLAQYEVYNPRNMGQGRMTWEELFESRMFGSYIVKSTLDNPQNKYIRTSVRDPLLALREGDKIKERIFNYEQDLWSY